MRTFRLHLKKFKKGKNTKQTQIMTDPQQPRRYFTSTIPTVPEYPEEDSSSDDDALASDPTLIQDDGGLSDVNNYEFDSESAVSGGRTYLTSSSVAPREIPFLVEGDLFPSVEPVIEAESQLPLEALKAEQSTTTDPPPDCAQVAVGASSVAVSGRSPRVPSKRSRDAEDSTVGPRVRKRLTWNSSSIFHTSSFTIPSNSRALDCHYNPLVYTYLYSQARGSSVVDPRTTSSSGRGGRVNAVQTTEKRIGRVFGFGDYRRGTMRRDGGQSFDLWRMTNVSHLSDLWRREWPILVQEAASRTAATRSARINETLSNALALPLVSTQLRIVRDRTLTEMSNADTSASSDASSWIDSLASCFTAEQCPQQQRPSSYRLLRPDRPCLLSDHLSGSDSKEGGQVKSANKQNTPQLMRAASFTPSTAPTTADGTTSTELILDDLGLVRPVVWCVPQLTDPSQIKDMDLLRQLLTGSPLTLSF